MARSFDVRTHNSPKAAGEKLWHTSAPRLNKLRRKVATRLDLGPAFCLPLVSTIPLLADSLCNAVSLMVETDYRGTDAPGK